MLQRLSSQILPRAEQDRIVNAVIATCLERCRPLEVYIFGSAADWQMRTVSDVDIAVIIERSDDVRGCYQQILSPGPLHPNVAVDVLVFDQTSFEKNALIGGVCYLIKNEGRKVYPSQGSGNVSE